MHHRRQRQSAGGSKSVVTSASLSLLKRTLGVPYGDALEVAVDVVGPNTSTTTTTTTAVVVVVGHRSLRIPSLGQFVNLEAKRTSQASRLSPAFPT